MTQLPYHSPGVVGFRDRSATLIASGIVLILMGCFAMCIGVAAPLALVVPQPPGMSRPPLGQVITGIAFYVVLAASLISVGIGAVRKLRWVRPVILALSGLWLAIGSISMVFVLLILPDMGRMMMAAVPPGAPKPPPQMVPVMMTVMTVFSATIYVIIPGVLILLYKSADVRATAQHYDPVPRWIEGVPIPLLALAALILLGSLSSLMTLPHAVVPLFGIVLHGTAGRIALIIIAGLFALAGALVMKLRTSGWLLGLVLMIVLPLAILATLLRFDLFQLYAMAGMTREQLDALHAIRFLSTAFVASAILLIALLTIGFVLWTKRFFPQATAHEP